MSTMDWRSIAMEKARRKLMSLKASLLPGFLLWKLTLNATVPEAGNQYLLFLGSLPT
ncbi:hypothetical protein D3C74_473690 [compost metagenome]